MNAFNGPANVKNLCSGSIWNLFPSAIERLEATVNQWTMSGQVMKLTFSS